jgi:hypothetical protein
MAEHEQPPSDAGMTPEEVVAYTYADLLRARISTADVALMILRMPGTRHIRESVEAMKRAGAFISFAELAAAQQGVDLDTVLENCERRLGDPDSDAAFVDLIAEKILLHGMHEADEIIKEDGVEDDSLSLAGWITELGTEFHEALRDKNPTLFEKARLKVARMLGTKAMVKAFGLPEDIARMAEVDVPLEEGNQKMIDVLAAKMVRDADVPFSLHAHALVAKEIKAKGIRVSPAEREAMERAFIEELRAMYKVTLGEPPASGTPPDEATPG